MSSTTIICVTCPIGCTIAVRGNGEVVESMEGAQCKRGEEYARNEYTAPVRILTSLVKVDGAEAPLAPVRSNRPIPKACMFDCMAVIRSVTLRAPVRRGDVVITNVGGTGADIVATGSAV